MDALDYAIQMEKDGEAYYRQLAHRTSNHGLKAILGMLADEEVKHQQVFEQMKTSKPAVEKSQLLTRAKNIFAEMKDAAEPLTDESSQVELYQKAQELEKKSEAYYLEQAGQADNPAETEIYQVLAKEEGRHYVMLENIIQFLSQPETWLEDAEFTHLEDY